MWTLTLSPATALLLMAVPGLLLLPTLLLLCLKIKSSKKDPAFLGTEGTICRINDLEASGDGGRTPSPRGAAAANSPLTPETTLRSGGGVGSGDRQLPAIPKMTSEDTQSDLYATVDENGLGPASSMHVSGLPVAGDHEDPRSTLYRPVVDGSESEGDTRADEEDEEEEEKSHHPYAKVKKAKLEHPYATVKKQPEPARSRPRSDVTDGAHARLSLEVADLDDLDAVDGEEVVGLLHARSGGSRSGSGRSGRGGGGGGGGGGDGGNNSGSNLDMAAVSTSSRQATPLPPEPHPHPHPHPHPPSQTNFSGDSQDSSKGYTSITVREPLRHIHASSSQQPLYPPPPVSNSAPGVVGQLASGVAADATYATVSETSDDMYAAIEEHTYVPTGANSQSNSDTYAMIDLPEEEEVELRASGGSDSPRRPPPTSKEGVGNFVPAPAVSIPYNAYSKVEKRKPRTSASMPPPPPMSGARRDEVNPSQLTSPTTTSKLNDNRRSYNVEDMYAKVHKRSSTQPQGSPTPTSSGEGRAGTGPGPGPGAGSSALLGARPKVRSADWGNVMDQHLREQQQQQQHSPRQQKSEINYSDYEVSLYDKDKKLSKHSKTKQSKRKAVNNYAAYETVMEPEPSYETVPALNPSSCTVYKDEKADDGLNSAAYERLPSDRGRVEKRVDVDDDDDAEDEYWRSTDSVGGGYETVPERENSREPGYEVVRNSGRLQQQQNQYDTLNRVRQQQQQQQRDPGYERVGPPVARGQSAVVTAVPAGGDVGRLAELKEPPYAKIASDLSDNDMGYETIPVNAGPGGGRIDRMKARERTNSDYDDPGYEMLSRDPGYETVLRGMRQGSGATVPGAAPPPPPPLTTGTQAYSVVVIERENGEFVADRNVTLPTQAARATSEADSATTEAAEVNTHIFI